MPNMSPPVGAPGFADVTMDSQRVFRRCLEALSRPAIPIDIPSTLPRIGRLEPVTAAILLALADYETTVWLDAAARVDAGISAYLRFHTAARISQHPEDADFAVVLDPLAMPHLAAFKQGTPDYPDRSTTVLVQTGSLRSSGALFKGPGIKGAVAFWADPLPSDFAAQLASNRQSFPCGVDLVFVARSAIAALPRSSAIQTNGFA